MRDLKVPYTQISPAYKIGQMFCKILSHWIKNKKYKKEKQKNVFLFLHAITIQAKSVFYIYYIKKHITKKFKNNCFFLDKNNKKLFYKKTKP